MKDASHTLRDFPDLTCAQSELDEIILDANAARRIDVFARRLRYQTTLDHAPLRKHCELVGQLRLIDVPESLDDGGG